MDSKNRRFSIPFSNNIQVDEYLSMIEPYKNNIENIYLGIPELGNHVSKQNALRNYNVNYEQSHDFLDKTKGKYKRLIAYNAISYNMNFNDLFLLFDDMIYPLIEKYEIDGFIITNLDLARKLRQDFPKIELHTSCNCFQWTIRQMETWREIAGIDVFNPPREAAKTPTMLKEMHDAGFKLKVLVTEACQYGCPHMITHACGVAEDKLLYLNSKCGSYEFSNVFRSNFFQPKWLKYIDEYVDIYKISGRNSYDYELSAMLDAYILGKEFTYIDEISTFGFSNPLAKFKENDIRIKLSDIPEKTRYCEAKDCNKTCFMCYDIFDRKYGIPNRDKIISIKNGL